MARVVNKTTFEIRQSVNTPEYSPTIWLINPDLSGLYNWHTGVYEVPVYYWKLVGSTIQEMNSEEKAAVDVLRLAAEKIVRKAYLSTRGGEYKIERYPGELINDLDSLYADAVRNRPRRAMYIQPWIDWLDVVNEEVKAKQAIVDTKTVIADVDAVVLDEATLTSQDPNITINGVNAITDEAGAQLRTFLNAQAVVTDPDTGIEGPFYLMQILEQRKDLYNDSENPIYKAGHVPILGFSGIAQDHANRVLNLENIHSKLGWHNQQVAKSLYSRPKDLLIYYGYPNSFNSGTNQWYNERVAQDMAKYNLIVLGDGVEAPTHPDYANSQVIIPRVKVLNPNALIFGYVASDQALASFQTKTDQWDALQVHGIFIDEAGYDYHAVSTGRADFNARVDYVHGKTYAKLAFANAWNTDHILGTADDASFPNSTYNSGLVASSLTSNDWILLESFAINTTAYSGSAGYESKSDWLVRGQKAVNLRGVFGVNFAACGIINNDNAAGQALANFGFTSAMMFSLDGFGTSDVSYAASSVTVTLWARPDVKGIGVSWALYPSVSVDVNDADVYWRYTELASLKVDFSSGAQTSSITKW